MILFVTNTIVYSVGVLGPLMVSSELARSLSESELAETIRTCSVRCYTNKSLWQKSNTTLDQKYLAEINELLKRYKYKVALKRKIRYGVKLRDNCTWKKEDGAKHD